MVSLGKCILISTVIPFAIFPLCRVPPIKKFNIFFGRCHVPPTENDKSPLLGEYDKGYYGSFAAIYFNIFSDLLL